LPKCDKDLTILIDELESCKSFIFSLVFITESGLATLKSIFKLETLAIF